MSNRPKKNRSARDKQLVRERARREAKKQQYPLHYLQPPFEPYREWIHVPDQAKDMIEHPARYDDLIPGGAKDLMDTLVKLGPRYHGIVPLAAIYLDEQMSQGTVAIAVTGRPGACRELSLTEFAGEISSPETLDKIRREYPDAGLPEQPSLMTDDAAAWYIHELHMHGFLVMDDDHVLNLAVSPKTPDGKWWLNGHDES